MIGKMELCKKVEELSHEMLLKVQQNRKSNTHLLEENNELKGQLNQANADIRTMKSLLLSAQ